MMYAYDREYLEKSRTALGRMLDFAVYDLNYDADEFFWLFTNSKTSKMFEKGDFTVTVGISGVELAYRVLEETLSNTTIRTKPTYSADRSAEYWAGWALAYYQWVTTLSFAQITKNISIHDIIGLYNPYHEMDIRQFCDKLTELYHSTKRNTNLKTMRLNANLTQRELAKLSGVPMRTIQQYEQRKKDINKAQADTLEKMACALSCAITDLMEKEMGLRQTP